MHCHRFLRQRRTDGGSCPDVTGKPVFESVAAECFSSLRCEQRGRRQTGSLGKPGPQDGDCARGERRDPLLSSLSVATHMCAHADFVQKIRVSKDGQWIATTGYDQTVRIWDSATGAEIMRIPINGVGSSIRLLILKSGLRCRSISGRLFSLSGDAWWAASSTCAFTACREA